MPDKPDLPFQCWIKAQRTGVAAYVIGGMYKPRDIVSSVGFVPKKGQVIHWVSWPDGFRYAPSS